MSIKIVLVWICLIVVSLSIELDRAGEFDCSKLRDQFTTTSNDLELFKLSVRNAWWHCGTEIAQGGGQDVNDLINALNVESRIVQDRLSTLKRVVESLKPMPTIVPAVQWAQSVDFIFLNVKFAHIISAPATLNVEERNVTLSGKSLYLEASDNKKLFKLDMEFEGDLSIEGSTWQMASVGRMTVNLKKADAPSRWSKGLINKGRGQVSRWTDLQERYEKELNQLKPSSPSSGSESDSESKKKEEVSDKEKDKEKDKEADKDKDADASGSIVTPEQQERKEKAKVRKAALDARKAELDATLAHIESETKKKKKDLEFETKEKRDKLDEEAKLKKDEARRKHAAEESASNKQDL